MTVLLNCVLRRLRGLVTLTPVAVRFAVELSVPVITTWVSGDRGSNFDLPHARRHSTSDPPRRRFYCYERHLISKTLYKKLTKIQKDAVMQM